MFAGLPDSDLDAIAGLGQYAVFRPGEALLRAGENWGRLLVILSGKVRLVDDRPGNSPVILDVVSEGCTLGENSLVSDGPGEFSAYALGETTAYQLLKESLDRYLDRHPQALKQIRSYAADQIVRTFLANSIVFSTLAPEQMDRLIPSLQCREIAKGAMLIRQAEHATEAYVIESGTFRVYRDGAPGEALAILTRGSVVGEAALVNNQPRNANVAAETPGRVFAIPKAVFLEILRQQKRFASAIEELARSRAPADQSDPVQAHGPYPQAQPEAESLDWKEPALPARHSFGRRFGMLAWVRQQSQMDCGPACLATICRHYGKRVNLNRLRELSRVGQAGSSMLSLLDAVRALGFEAFPVLSTLDQLRGAPLPAMVNWRGYHWIVVYRVEADRVVASDPAQGRVKIPLGEFIAGWTRYTLYLRPTLRFLQVPEERPALSQFIPYIRPHRKLLFEIALASFSVQLLALMLPVFIQFVIDNIVVKKDPRWLLYSLSAISVLMVMESVIGWLRQKMLLFVAFCINVPLVTDLYRHLLSLPLPFFENRKVGDLTSRFADNESVTRFFTHTGIDIPIDLFASITYLGLMIYYNVPLTLIAVFFTALQILHLRFFTPRLRDAHRAGFQKQADTSSHLIESISGLRTIKVLGAEHLVRWKFEDLFAGSANAYFKTIVWSMISSVAASVEDQAATITILFYGAVLIIQNRLTIGELVAFMALARNLNAPVHKLVDFWNQFQETLISVERLNDILDVPPADPPKAPEGKEELRALRGNIRFENVTFRYHADGKNVLQNITLDIKRGQRVAFVGRSGSGKSTLLKLLLGFYPVSSGRIYVDGFALDDVWLPSLRRHVGVVPQESFLFPGTVRENISQTAPGASLQAVVDASLRAGAHEFVSALPNGYDTMIEENAANLSGGQKQRIAIARAILQNPAMLILDEATSALDNESERAFLRNLDTVFGECTVLSIAHRMSTVRKADLIVVIDQGTIIEQGTHEQLMKQQGLYYFLATQQLNL
jgi:ATP-binding cassette subfamily B protein